MNNYTMSITDRIRYFFSSGKTLPVIILINIAVWISIKAVTVVAFLFSAPGSDISASVTAWVLNWLAVPASIPSLSTRAYTLLTYMFLHIDFLHLLFNMLWLYWFGKIFIEYLNNRQLAFTYLSGGLVGALIYIAFFNAFPVFSESIHRSVALGASASVLAVVVAISFFVPNYTIYLLLIGPIKIRHIAIVTVIIDFFMIKSGNAGGHIAHLGGALWGFAFIYLLKRRIDLSIILRPPSRIRFSSLFHSTGKTKFRKVHTAGTRLTDEEYNIRRVNRQKLIDEILEKIKQSGYESLTREEKEFLFNHSQKD